MVGAIILFASLCSQQSADQVRYRAQYLFEADGSSGTRMFGHVTVTEHDYIAGFTVSPGFHGGDLISRPFFVMFGSPHWLPLDGAEFGHVYAADTEGLYGDVYVDREFVPAKWVPSEEPAVIGWITPKLVILGKEPGSVVAVSANGDLWVQPKRPMFERPVRRLRKGVWETTELRDFKMIGVDSMGRWYGATDRAYARGEFYDSVSVRDRDSTKKISGSDFARIRAVNDKGWVVGNAWSDADEVWRAVLWRDGKKIELLPGSTQWSLAKAVNNNGQIVGEYTAEDGKYHAFVWKDGVLRDLSAEVPGMTLSKAIAINDRGTIVAVATFQKRERLYRLSPRTP